MRLDDAPRFLTYEELAREIARYTYRKGWDLSVFLDPWEGPCLYIVADVADGYHPERTVQLRIRSNIPPMADANAFGWWILWRVSQIESHEVREMLRRDGELLVDPHDPAEPIARSPRNAHLP
jgi:hypothetical protein